MRNALLLLIVVFIALCAVGLWLVQSDRPDPDANAVADAPDVAAPLPPPARPRPQPASPDAQAFAAAPPAPQAPSPAPQAQPPPSTFDPRSPAPPSESQPPPQLESAPPPVDKEAVRTAIKSVTPLVAQCFEDARDRYPPPQNVKLRFTIVGQGISGHFKDGEIADSTIVDPWVQSCFLEALVDARFPAPEGGGEVTVTYPFHFADRAPPDAGLR